MVECGYGVSWRVLDSQYFGVAQRRQRVFIVGSFGKPCPPEILFEPGSGARNTAKGKRTRKGSAQESSDSFILSKQQPTPPTDTTKAPRSTAFMNSQLSALHPTQPTRNINTIKAQRSKAINRQSSFNLSGDMMNEQDLKQESHNITESTERTSPSPTIQATGSKGGAFAPAIAYCITSTHRGVDKGHNTTYVESPVGISAGESDPLSGSEAERENISDSRVRDAGDQAPHVLAPTLPHKRVRETPRQRGEYTASIMLQATTQLRRLTPTECETLQGFPKGWTVPATEHWATRSRSKWRNGSRGE